MPILLMLFVGLVAAVVIALAIVYVFAFFNINLAHYPWEVLAALLIFILIVLFVYLGKERLRAQRGLVQDAGSIQRKKGRSVPGGQPIDKE